MCIVPGETAVGATKQVVAFGTVLASPAGQVEHWRSAVGVPAVLTKLPGSQVLHASQLVALVVVLNVSDAHAVHVRLAFALPSAPTLWPGTQSVHATQGVAGLLSWSHEPLAHDSFAAVPPAQWVPTSHATHLGGDEPDPAAVCTVPAGHAPMATHEAWFGDEEDVPVGQGAHSWSEVAVPGVVT